MPLHWPDLPYEARETAGARVAQKKSEDLAADVPAPARAAPADPDATQGRPRDPPEPPKPIRRRRRGDIDLADLVDDPFYSSATFHTAVMDRARKWAPGDHPRRRGRAPDLPLRRRVLRVRVLAKSPPRREARRKRGRDRGRRRGRRRRRRASLLPRRGPGHLLVSLRPRVRFRARVPDRERARVRARLRELVRRRESRGRPREGGEPLRGRGLGDAAAVRIRRAVALRDAVRV